MKILYAFWYLFLGLFSPKMAPSVTHAMQYISTACEVAMTFWSGLKARTG